MRYVGRIAEWNDEKGYGFVTPNGGGDRAFVHIRAFGRASRRPVTGELISYDLKKDERGRFNAASIRFVAQPVKNESARRGKWPRKSAGAVFLAALVFGWLLAKIPPVVPLVYCVMSALAILLYHRDKIGAKNNQWRIQESTLLMVGLLCGWPGALFAQDAFRHKSKKAEFQFAFLFTVILNCGALFWLLSSGTAAVMNGNVLGP